MSNRLREIEALGQSIWIDNISRQLLEDGIMARLVEEDGISGVTSNPTIFEKAMAHSDRYDDAFREVIDDTKDPQEIFEQLAYRDIQDAADLLRGAWEKTNGADGYVSFEVPASVAFDARKTIDAAQRYKREIDRPNVLIKVPGTGEGVEAFEELTALGVNVNVTLLFAVERYEEIAEAFLKGLERRVEAGESIDKSASVASFFVSRVDSKVDKALEGTGHEDLRGKAAVANARIAYESFQRIFSGPRWEALAAKGARVQRPLWASTSTKNPDYPDTLYVDELIGPDTVNTMPDKTIEASRDHATAARTVDKDIEAAHKLIDEVKAAGVDFDKIVQQELVDEGVKSFSDSYDSLLDSIKGKTSELVHAA
ncbi:MAG TPA: transaldolase [Solirubrobacteraceae bacterium]|nr:transaldolase [Solirubrobacteraceae bacterium]